MKKKNILWMLILIFSLSSIIVFAGDLPSVMYVASKEGLNRRELPSSASNKLGTLLHGSRVIAHERSNSKETIDGITDYWYRCSGGISGGGGGFYWVFGGYLSFTIPEDTEPVIGRWNTDRGAREYWYFQPDNIVSSGTKESGRGWIGTWTLSGNRLTIIKTPIEFHTGENETLEIIITIISRDKIILSFYDGNTEILERTNDII